MACSKGDMIVLPEGIYHRFTLDSKDYIKVHLLNELMGAPNVSSEIMCCQKLEVLHPNGFSSAT